MPSRLSGANAAWWVLTIRAFNLNCNHPAWLAITHKYVTQLRVSEGKLLNRMNRLLTFPK